MAHQIYNLSWSDKSRLVIEQSAIRFYEYFSVQTPKSIKKRIFETNLEKVDSIQEPLAILRMAYQYWYLADFYWSSNNIINGIKSGWFYALSAYCFKKVGSYALAGDLYHFSGHQFRRWGSYERAMEYYFLSANTLYKYCPDDEESLKFAQRSIKRAIGLSKTNGDEEGLMEWMKGEPYFRIYLGQYKDQNIWD